jgi:hypothetical protein
MTRIGRPDVVDVALVLDPEAPRGPVVDVALVPIDPDNNGIVIEVALVPVAKQSGQFDEKLISEYRSFPKPSTRVTRAIASRAARVLDRRKLVAWSFAVKSRDGWRDRKTGVRLRRCLELDPLRAEAHSPGEPRRSGGPLRRPERDHPEPGQPRRGRAGLVSDRGDGLVPRRWGDLHRRVGAGAVRARLREEGQLRGQLPPAQRV